MAKNEIVLTAALTALAEKEIEAFAKDEQGARKVSDNLSMHLLRLAKEAEKVDKTNAADVFGAMTKHAERAYAEKHGGKDKLPISKLLPSWRFYKSQVTAGFRSKVTMADKKSLYDVVQETKAEPRKPKTPNGETGAPKVTEGINAALQALLKVIAASKPEYEDQIIAVLAEAEAEIAQLAHIDEEANVKGRSPTREAGATA